jgi:DNA-binding NarL/FixJ family response regulator
VSAGAAATLRLLLADPQRSFAEALALRLDAEADLEVVGNVADLAEAPGVISRRSVDVVLLGVDGNPGRVLAAADALLSERPHLVLLALAEHDDLPALARAVRIGFRGWVPKQLDVASFVEVLRGARRGETYIPPALLTRLLPYLLEEFEERRAAELPFSTLTPREREVLQAMCRGATREQIAGELKVSRNTVRTHTQSILGKLGVHTSLAAVAMTRGAGLG